MKELKGTEKQIAWAEKIRQYAVQKMEARTSFIGTFATDREEKRNLRKIEEIREDIESIESASTWIDIRDSYTDNVSEYISEQNYRITLMKEGKM